MVSLNSAIEGVLELTRHDMAGPDVTVHPVAEAQSAAGGREFVYLVVRNAACPQIPTPR